MVDSGNIVVLVPNCFWRSFINGKYNRKTNQRTGWGTGINENCRSKFHLARMAATKLDFLDSIEYLISEVWSD
jgi:hypothetical protein